VLRRFYKIYKIFFLEWENKKFETIPAVTFYILNLKHLKFLNDNCEKKILEYLELKIMFI